MLNSSHFYGIDWIGMVATFASLWLLGEKKRFGFVIGALAAASWAIFSWLAGSVPGVIANVVFFFLNLYNLSKWSK